MCTINQVLNDYWTMIQTNSTFLPIKLRIKYGSDRHTLVKRETWLMNHPVSTLVDVRKCVRHSNERT